MIELRADDLGFMLEETAIFLSTSMGLSLTPQDIAKPDSRTEGWITGLHLAALSMQGRPDVSDFSAAFTGQDRYVVDYVLEEVFESNLSRDCHAVS